MLAKHEFRSRYRLIRSKSSNSEDVESVAKMFADRVSEYLRGKTGNWAIYKSIPNESPTEEIIKKISWVNWVYPKIEASGEMNFYQSKTISKGLVDSDFNSNHLGILEPNPIRSKLCELDKVQGVIIPGVAFDCSGGRLGQGKGFYDKALKNYRGVKAGLAFSSQIAEEKLPVEAHDISMNIIITEEKIIEINKEGI